MLGRSGPVASHDGAAPERSEPLTSRETAGLGPEASAIRSRTRQVKKLARSFGFSPVGITTADAFDDAAEALALHRVAGGAGEGVPDDVVAVEALDDEEALTTARTNTQSFSILNVHLDPNDHSKALERLGQRLAQRMKGSKK